MQQFTTQMLNHNPEDYTEEFRLKKYYIISSIINLFNLNNRKKGFRQGSDSKNSTPVATLA